jgi:uncharacterized protein YbjT (DUF2867 family)
MDQEELARRAHVSVVAVRRAESVGGTQEVGSETVAEIRQALENAGARFILDGVQRRPELSPEAEERYRAAMKIAKECAALLEGTPPFTEADLYDENGL